MSPKQKKYARNRAKGMTRKQSAITAGLAPSQTLEELPTVQHELAKIRATMAADANITREDVVAMLIDAAGMAKLMSDPTAMIAAAREIGKILGHYAPEIKKIVKGMDQGDVKKALENMSDDELFKLAYARTKVIDGEFRTVDDKNLLTVRTGEEVTPVLQEDGDMPTVPDGEPTKTT